MWYLLQGVLVQAVPGQLLLLRMQVALLGAVAACAAAQRAQMPRCHKLADAESDASTDVCSDSCADLSTDTQPDPEPDACADACADASVSLRERPTGERQVVRRA